MGVRDTQHFQEALNAAVFPTPPMQCVENHVGRSVAKLVRQIAARINFSDVVTRFTERVGAFAARDERNLALGRPAAFQHRYAGSPARHPRLTSSPHFSGLIIRSAFRRSV